ncbi:MAG TPA: Pycsar system effector family protein [Chryseosolibacter sp.]|nr:Pycsar system effector family protein [Chryseosolibacter sp.]
MESQLISKARAFAENVFKDRTFDDRPFHNLEHTTNVVSAVEEIGTHIELTEDEMESAIVAAWLHDIGFLEGEGDHERHAADKARELLDSWGASQKKIAEVTEAILSTKIPQQPKSLVSKVLCDADLYHLSTASCTEQSARLRQEWETQGKGSMRDEEWLRHNLKFLENHRYHTPYGQTILQAGKKKNIKKFRKDLQPEINEKDYHKLEDDLVKLRSKLEKERLQKPDRGIETMFRTTSGNHIMLSQMADNKANILITINSIILSVVVSVLVRKLEEDPRLVVPTIMLVSVCLATIVFAILATRPNVSAGRFTREDIRNKKTNLLFFGNFHGMNVEDYEWSMKQMMKDADYLYGSLIKDIYYLGRVLGKKYKFLRIAYNIFMYGFVIAILSFVIVMMLPRY